MILFTHFDSSGILNIFVHTTAQHLWWKICEKKLVTPPRDRNRYIYKPYKKKHSEKYTILARLRLRKINKAYYKNKSFAHKILKQKVTCTDSVTYAITRDIKTHDIINPIYTTTTIYITIKKIT